MTFFLKGTEFGDSLGHACMNNTVLVTIFLKDSFDVV